MAQTAPEKLHLQKGEQLLVLNAPHNLEALLLPLPEGASLVTEVAREYPVVLGFVEQLRDLTEIWHKLRTGVSPHGAIWVAYPKKTGTIRSDLHRDVLAAQVQVLSPDWTVVSLISLDATWSAMRFRRVEDIPKLTRNF